MALSERTKTKISGSEKRDINEIYPDREATYPYEKKDTGTTYRLNDEVPRTSEDMHDLFTWQHGDTIYGTHAKSHPGMAGYIKDINKAYDKEDQYKDIYLDNFKKISDEKKRFELI